MTTNWIRRVGIGLFATALSLCGCSSDDDGYDALFSGPQDNMNRESVFGVWAAAVDDVQLTDYRLRFSQGSVDFAARCKSEDGRGSKVIGVTAAADVTEQRVVIKESVKQEIYVASNEKCSLSIHEGEHAVQIANGKMLLPLATEDGAIEATWEKMAD